jgi:hypothetical protein
MKKTYHNSRFGCRNPLLSWYRRTDSPSFGVRMEEGIMFRRSLIHPCLILGISAFGCAKDLELDPNPPSPDNLGAVVAQFDPSNPVGVLQIVPSPTALAQKPDGTIDQAAVAPEPCELPTNAQCLQFVEGWPLTTPITLYFSGNVDQNSVLSGVSLYELDSATGDLRKIELRFADPNTPISARPLPRTACERDENGATRYTLEQVPPGIQVVLVPTEPIKPRTVYFVKVESTESGGVRDAEGNRVDPSALFSLLNVDDENAPVTMDGVLTSALLRSQVQATILRSPTFMGKELRDLDDTERAQFEQALAGAGVRLRGLYQFFSGIGDKLISEGELANREDAVFLNMWLSGGETQLEFDPANNKFPFPNLPLMTRTSTDGIMVYLPPDPRDTPTAAALKVGLNTLDGFSNTAPIAITFTANLDPDTLLDHIVVRLVDDQGRATGEPVPVTLTYTASSAFGPANVAIRPLMPLLQDQMYVVAVTRGLEDEGGFAVAPSTTFRLLRDIDEPFTSNPIPPLAEQGFQCSTVPTTGMLADPSTVQGLAMRLEDAANHPRWTESVRALEMATTATIAREDLLMAFLYKTQSITPVVDAVKNVLQPNVWEQLDARPRVVGPVIEVVGSSSIAELIGVVPRFCVAFCEAGAMLPDVPVNECATRDMAGNITSVNPAVPTHLVCQLAHQVIVGNLGSASLYLMKGYRATVGSPFASGTFRPETIMEPDVIDLPFWVVRSANTQPETGYPVAIFQHGLGGNKEQGFLIANTLANTGDGWATVLLDFPFHGARASDIINNTTMAPCVDQNGVPDVDPALVTCDPNTGMCAGGCDGLQDPSATGLLSPNLFGTRDNFRQGTIDHLTLLRTLREDGASLGLDPTRIGYIGQSLGGISGGNFAAYVRPDEVQAVVLNVAGGSLTNILLNTVPQISAGLYAALAANGICEFNVPNNPASGCMPTAAFRQFVLIAQWVLDPGDPLGTSIGAIYDRTVLTPAGPVEIPALGPENILMQMSRPDPVVTNSSSLLLGLAYGFDLDPTVEPFASNDEHFQIWDFTGLPQTMSGSGCHGFLLAPICGAINDNGTPNLPDILCNTAGAQIQAAGFLESGGAVVPPMRPAQVSGIPCP